MEEEGREEKRRDMRKELKRGDYKREGTCRQIEEKLECSEKQCQRTIIVVFTAAINSHFQWWCWYRWWHSGTHNYDINPK